MRETFKDVTIANRKFRIGKFDALTGSYIVYTVLTQVLPMGLGAEIEGLDENVPKSAAVMSKETFFNLQKDCLKLCSEIRAVNDQVIPVPIITVDGRWAVEDLEHNAPLVLMLTINVLGYNLQSFFDANVLEEFKNGIAQFNLSNV